MSRTGLGRARSTSLQSVREDTDTPDNADQLPTPRETPQPEGQTSRPVISDTLYFRMDNILESDDSGASRTRTADSGNPLFTIADRSGVFDMEIIFCVCSDSDNTAEQLLRSGLFPATFKQIETLFTFSVLEDFLTDNLECKTTAQQYYSKLQSMTSKMFPGSVPVSFSIMLSCRSNQQS
jgi:CxC2 like cysteine cluster associated with KDZ transposases